VPTLLHTPLMSGTNAIHGIVIVGAILITGANLHSTLAQVVGFFAVVWPAQTWSAGSRSPTACSRCSRGDSRVNANLTTLAYLPTIVSFILALSSSPLRSTRDWAISSEPSAWRSPSP